jgi:hypothetical protein
MNVKLPRFQTKSATSGCLADRRCNFIGYSRYSLLDSHRERWLNAAIVANTETKGAWTAHNMHTG